MSSSDPESCSRVESHGISDEWIDYQYLCLLLSPAWAAHELKGMEFLIKSMGHKPLLGLLQDLKETVAIKPLIMLLCHTFGPDLTKYSTECGFCHFLSALAYKKFITASLQWCSYDLLTDLSKGYNSCIVLKERQYKTMLFLSALSSASLER